MKQQFTASQVSKVIDQALVYQCACPAQVCRAIFELRELYEYQVNCANDSSSDARVHQSIAEATDKAHAAMEDCLRQILAIEGWDPVTLAIPESLKKKPVKRL
jgi:hypothetical protein